VLPSVSLTPGPFLLPSPFHPRLFCDHAPSAAKKFSPRGSVPGLSFSVPLEPCEAPPSRSGARLFVAVHSFNRMIRPRLAARPSSSFHSFPPTTFLPYFWLDPFFLRMFLRPSALFFRAVSGSVLQTFTYSCEDHFSFCPPASRWFSLTLPRFL